MKKCNTCKEAEELCKATYVMKDMVDRLYKAENNLEQNIKRIIKERELVSEFEEKSIEYFKENGNLPEWFIRYKLGTRLTYGYNLIYGEEGEEEYKEDKNYSVGYKGWWIYGGSDEWMREGKWIDKSDAGLREWLDDDDPPDLNGESDDDAPDLNDESEDDSNNMGYERKWKPDGTKYHKFEHFRFNYDTGFSDSNQEIMDIFQNYYFDKKVLVYSHEGAMYVEIIDKHKQPHKSSSSCNSVPGDYEYAGYGTLGSIEEILSMIHIEVFSNKKPRKRYFRFS